MTYNPDRDTFAAPDRRQTLQEQWREVSARIDAEEAAKAAARATPPLALAAPQPEPTLDAAGRQLRHDGWTADRQRAFLSAIADGETVERACRLVQLSVASAYAFRQRAAGAAFALGWRAANLLARDRIADRMMARALDGQVETVTRPDGSVISRHRFDNRAAMNMLTRLDRMVEQAPADPAAAATGHAARLIAQDFEAFLDTIEQDRGPAAAGLFLARRTGLAGTAAAAELDPILALARADTFVRTGVSLVEEIATADLDPAQRATWTAGQWSRAEAAGLLRLAPTPEAADDAPEPPLPQLVPDRGPVWWDEEREEYRTSFPPAGDDDVFADGDYGDADYERSLGEDERALIDAAAAIDVEERRVVDAADRDAWFARVQAAIADALAAQDAPPPAATAAAAAAAAAAADDVVGEDAAPDHAGPSARHPLIEPSARPI